MAVNNWQMLLTTVLMLLLVSCSASKEVLHDYPSRIEGCGTAAEVLVDLSEEHWCQLELLAERCNEYDSCLIECMAAGDGEHVGGGCFHICLSGDLLIMQEDGSMVRKEIAWVPPDGWEECK